MPARKRNMVALPTFVAPLERLHRDPSSQRRRQAADIVACTSEFSRHESLRHDLSIRGATRAGSLKTQAMVDSYPDALDDALEGAA
jgi:hypothetical protein